MKVVAFWGGVMVVKACAFDNQVTQGCVVIKESLTYTASEARLSWLCQGEMSECCMLQRSIFADRKVTWHDGRCDDPDDFQVFLRAFVELSGFEEGDQVCLIPVDSSIDYQTPADLDHDAVFKKEQMALCGDVVSVKVRVKAKPPFSVLCVKLRWPADTTIHLNMSSSLSGVGKTIKRVAKNIGTRIRRREQDVRGER